MSAFNVMSKSFSLTRSPCFSRSLVETSAEVGPDSLAEIRGLTHAELARRIAKVEAFSDDMQKANDEMAHQNDVLSSKISNVRTLLKAKETAEPA